MKLSQAAVSNEPNFSSVNSLDGATRSPLSAPSAAKGAIASPQLGCSTRTSERDRYPRHVPVALFDRARYAYLNSFSQLPKMALNLDGD